MVSQITDEAMIVCPNPSACLLLPSAYVLRNDGTKFILSVCLYILPKFTVPVDFLQCRKYTVMKREEVK